MGNGYIVDISYRIWEDDAISVSELDKTYEYGIVLGGFSGYDNKKDRIEFKDYGGLDIDVEVSYGRDVKFIPYEGMNESDW